MGNSKKLEKTVDDFVKEMKAKLRIKMNHGYSGWDKPENKGMILEKLSWNLKEKDYVDVANLAMMLWNFSRERN